MSDPRDTPTVRVTRRFPRHTPERVFDAFVTPATAARFLFATETGEVVRCAIDARVGGRWEIVDRRDGEDVVHEGEYLEVERPRRLVFTLRVPKYEDATSTVAIEIAPDGAGCALTLTHGGVLASYAKQTESGWSKILETLEAAL